MDFFRSSFARAGAIAFLGETVAHVAVIVGWLPNLMALSRWGGFFTDWYIIILGGYSAIGLWVFWSQVRIKRCSSCFWYWFTTLFLTATVLLHAYIVIRDDLAHETLQRFPWGYSLLGLVYSLFFAWRLIRLQLVPKEDEE